MTTNPAGAAIEVDGIPAGASPATIPGLSAGVHNLTITKPGYADLITQVNIVGGPDHGIIHHAYPRHKSHKTPAAGFEALVTTNGVTCIVLLKRPI